ncbi:MAG: hypothetical protein ABIO04_06440 [Ferruginibacter sp.]
MFKPLIPIVADAWEHEFNKLEHLSFHQKYGNHHVEKELEENNKDDQNKGTNCLKSEDQVPFHILSTEYSNSIKSIDFNNYFSPSPSSKLPSIFIAQEGPPPKCV